MTAITAGSVTANVRPAAKAATSGKPGLFARAWAAFIESRMKQAEREIRLHGHLLPTQFEIAGERLARKEKELPFAR